LTLNSPVPGSSPLKGTGTGNGTGIGKGSISTQTSSSSSTSLSQELDSEPNSPLLVLSPKKGTCFFSWKLIGD
jgi:hypothetical protein